MYYESSLKRLATALLLLTLLTGVVSIKVAFLFWVAFLACGISSGNLHEEKARWLKFSSIGFVTTFLIVVIDFALGFLTPVEAIIGTVLTVGGATIYVVRVTNAQEWLLLEREHHQRIAGKR